jgi:hypothetical protein
MIPRSKDQQTKETQIKPEDEDRRYWEEEDEGYFGEMEEDEQDEDLEEAYRSVLWLQHYCLTKMFILFGHCRALSLARGYPGSILAGVCWRNH